MGNPAGVRRDFDALEKRRFEAIRLMDAGVNKTEVARRVHVARQTVSRWDRRRRNDGERAVKKAGRAGRKPQLDRDQLARLEQLLMSGPESLGYQTPLWTCPRVARLIEQEFGVSYHPGHVWKILVALGWSCQRPGGRTGERSEEEIGHWKQRRRPAIKKSAHSRAQNHLHRKKRNKPAAAPDRRILTTGQLLF